MARWPGSQAVLSGAGVLHAHCLTLIRNCLLHTLTLSGAGVLHALRLTPIRHRLLHTSTCLALLSSCLWNTTHISVIVDKTYCTHSWAWSNCKTQYFITLAAFCTNKCSFLNLGTNNKTIEHPLYTITNFTLPWTNHWTIARSNNWTPFVQYEELYYAFRTDHWTIAQQSDSLRRQWHCKTNPPIWWAREMVPLEAISNQALI